MRDTINVTCYVAVDAALTCVCVCGVWCVRAQQGVLSLKWVFLGIPTIYDSMIMMHSI